MHIVQSCSERLPLRVLSGTGKDHNKKGRRVQAERKCGELLAPMPKAKGGNPNLPKSTPSELLGVDTLADLGITYKQSSEWQKLASVPSETFEEAIADAVTNG